MATNIKLTADIVKRALTAGGVTYNLRGDATAVDPVVARKILLRKISALESGEPQIDLSRAFSR